MPEAVICEPLRTPVGRFGGMFRDVPARNAGRRVIPELVAPNRTSGDDIDDVVLGQGSPSGEAPAIGRVAALDAGLGIERARAAGRPALRAGLQAVMTVHAGADRCLRPGARRRHGVDEPGRVLRDRAPLGGQGARRVPRRSARPRPGSPRAGRTSRCPAAWSRRPRTCGPEYWTSAARIRTRSRCSRTSEPWRRRRPECSRRRSSRSRFPAPK